MISPGSHEIAARHAKELVKECAAAGISWPEIALACESVIVVVVAAAAQSVHIDDPISFATEIIDLMTEQAQKRIIAVLLKESHHD
jgi:hypothetical protein